MMTTVDPSSILSTRNLIDVGVQADDVRRRMHGIRTTFVRIFEVHTSAVPSAIPSGVVAGEFRIVGRPANPDAAVAIAEATAALAKNHAAQRKELFPPTTGFSLVELRAISGTDAEFMSLCKQLRDAGFESIAEVALDRLDDADDAIIAAREAGLRVERLTVETLPLAANGVDPRVAIVERAKALQERVGGFKVFAPLPRTMSIAAPTTGYDDVKLIALARLVVSNIDSIQVDWPLYGPKLAQVALTMGADDVDGIAALDPGLLGTRRSAIEEIKGNIVAASLDPVERDGRFQPVADAGH